MEYTVKKLGMLAGISPRTLRYYDEIGLLKPSRINSSGYRIYGKSEVDKLQQILFYKELGMELERIMAILNDPTFDGHETLIEHRAKLLAKREQLDLLIANVDKTIGEKEGRFNMSDKEKFEGFKQKLIDDNERVYGKEIRKKYGNESVNQSNTKLQKMTWEEYEKATRLGEQVLKTLAEAFYTGDPAGGIAQKAAELHKQWLTYYWSEYSKKAHANIAQMYVDDDRFKAYYDKEKDGMAEFLRDAVHIYTGMKK